jgi:hypothetical protein
MDLFVVPTISFRLLYGLLMYGLLILLHDRRRILWLGATTHPTAEWIARQLIEACGCKQAPHYLVHDRDRSYGEASACWRHGHPRSTDITPIAEAKQICGTADWFDPTGVYRSCRCAW